MSSGGHRRHSASRTVGTSENPGGRPEVAGRYLEGALRKAGQVKAVEQLLVRQGAAVRLHLVGTDERGLPLEHEVAVAGPQQLGGSLLGRGAWSLENRVTQAPVLALLSKPGPAAGAAEGGRSGGPPAPSLLKGGTVTTTGATQAELTAPLGSLPHAGTPRHRRATPWT